ncbi:MAG: hypothetical protein IT440_11740 [Phycisphaeraceae bacterium]|nr:hypothetical protein [Phycisphaeraceae bacterium]
MIRTTYKLTHRLPVVQTKTEAGQPVPLTGIKDVGNQLPDVLLLSCRATQVEPPDCWLEGFVKMTKPQETKIITSVTQKCLGVLIASGHMCHQWGMDKIGDPGILTTYD